MILTGPPADEICIIGPGSCAESGVFAVIEATPDGIDAMPEGIAELIMKEPVS